MHERFPCVPIYWGIPVTAEPSGVSKRVVFDYSPRHDARCLFWQCYCHFLCLGLFAVFCFVLSLCLRGDLPCERKAINKRISIHTNCLCFCTSAPTQPVCAEYLLRKQTDAFCLLFGYKRNVLVCLGAQNCTTHTKMKQMKKSKRRKWHRFC